MLVLSVQVKQARGLLARTVFRSFDITRLSLSNKIWKNNHIWGIICPNFLPLFLSDFDIFRKKKTYMAGIRLHTFWSILRNYVLEAIQTRTVNNFGAFYYMFIVNVGLYKEPEFAPTKIHPKLKQKHAFYLENTKIVQSVCTEVLLS